MDNQFCTRQAENDLLDNNNHIFDQCDFRPGVDSVFQCGRCCGCLLTRDHDSIHPLFKKNKIGRIKNGMVSPAYLPGLRPGKRNSIHVIIPANIPGITHFHSHLFYCISANKTDQAG